MLFVGTLKKPFLGRILGGATKDFSDIIMNGEMIEQAIRNGKLDDEESSKKPYYKKKNNEGGDTGVHNVSYSKASTWQPKAASSNTQKPKQNQNQKTEREFTPIPISYGELFKNLYNAHVVSPFYMKPIQPPYPKWYNPNTQCEYHAGAVGHSIEDYIGFKKLIEKLMQIGVVRFDDSAGTAETDNPLPNHADPGVNAIVDQNSRRTKSRVDEVRSPLKWVWKMLVARGMIPPASGGIEAISQSSVSYTHLTLPTICSV